MESKQVQPLQLWVDLDNNGNKWEFHILYIQG